MHNVLAGTAANVVQARSIGSVVLHETRADLPVPQQLPRLAARFVDRADTLSQLTALTVERTDGPVHTIAGTPGVGKTALVVQWAHQIRDHFPDGILYADLHGFDPVNPPADPGEVLDGFLGALHVPEGRIRGGLDARASMFRTMLGDRRILIILDDAASEEQVRPLLPGSGKVAVVVTSRRSLAGLAIREGATTVDLTPLPPSEAAALVGRIVGEQRLRGEGPAVADLVRLCGDLPLPLCIAAQRLVADPFLTVTDFVAELAGDRSRLDLLDTGDQATAIRAVFSASYRALTPTAARAFRLLGLHPGAEFGIPAAMALTMLDESGTREVLGMLAAAHLLEPAGRDRFRFHDLVRVYAAERANTDEPVAQRKQAVNAVLTWYLGTANGAARLLAPHHRPLQWLDDPLPRTGRYPELSGTDEAIAWLDRERPSLVGAVRAAANADEHDIAWKLAAALWPFFHRRKPWTEWIDTYTLAARSARKVQDDVGMATILTGLAVALREQRHYREAENKFLEALRLWDAADGEWGHAWAANGLAQLARELGRREEALAHAQHALRIWAKVGDRHGQGVAHNSMSGIYRDLHRPNDALVHSEHAIEAFRAVADQHGEVWALGNAATVHRDLGQLDHAVALYRYVLHVRRALDDRYGQAFTLDSLGDTLHRLGRTAEAVEAWTFALEIFAELSDPKAEDVRRALGRV